MTPKEFVEQAWKEHPEWDTADIVAAARVEVLRELSGKLDSIGGEGWLVAEIRESFRQAINAEIAALEGGKGEG